MTAAPPPERQSLTVQTFWFAAAKTIAFILTSIAPLLLVRLLDQTELGFYKQAFLVVASAQRVLTLGFGLSAFYFFPRLRNQEKPIVANIVVFNAVIGLAGWAVFAAYPPVLEAIFGTPDLLGQAHLIGAIIFLWVFSSFLEIAPAAMQETRMSTILIVTMQLSRMLFMMGAALWSASLEALLWSAIAQGVLQSLILLWYLNRQFPGYLGHLSGSEFRKQFGYILPLTAAYFIGVLTADAPQYIVANHFNPALFAVFTIGTFQLPLINILHESVGMVLTPAVSRLHHEGRTRDIAVLLAAAMRKTAAIAFPVFFGMIVVTHEFIVLLYTKLYAASAPIFAVNLALLPLTFLIYEPLVRSFDEVRTMLVWVRSVILAVLVLAVWLGVKQDSMTAAIYAVVVAAAAERLAIFWKLGRLLHLTWADRGLFTDIGKIAAAGLTGTLVIAALRVALIPFGPLAVLLGCGTVFCAVYLAALILFKVPTAEEWQMALGLAQRFRRRPLNIA